MAYIINQLIKKEDKYALLSQFKAWDTNGDGVLSRDEIYQGYKELYGDDIARIEVV